MASAALPAFSQTGDNRSIAAHELSADLLARRLRLRRQALLVQAISYTINTLVLLIYVHAGTIPLSVPANFLCIGMSLVGVFLLLSETGFNDRFREHYLMVYQVVAHLLVQLGFLMSEPQIGSEFLGVVFLIFGYGALRMSSRQAAIAWSVTTIGLTAIFILTTSPVGIPIATATERLAAMLGFVATIGQCAFVGVYGNGLRQKLYKNSLELTRAYSRIEELAELDELTGAYNRRCIMRLLSEELTRAQRLQHPCAVALIDLDWFKRINDTFGHPTGDEVLRTFAITLFANIREIDRFGRYGGEEFLLVLPETAEPAAARMLERLRLIVSELDWSAFSSDMMVTISAGVAAIQPGETAESLLARADRALYAAKGGGRNRIASA